MKVSRPGARPTFKAPEIAGAKGLTAKPENAAAKPVAAPRPEAGATHAASKATRVSDIAADLKAGKLTSGAALDKVIERVLDRQLGARAPASLREKVGAALRDALADDPLLASKVRTLERD